MHYLAILYFIVGALQVFGCYLGATEGSNTVLVLILRDGLKWFLMPILALFYYKSLSYPLSSFHKKMILALFFSWLGDIFLIFGTDEKPLFFLLGLVSFLIAHVMYVTVFIQVEEKNVKTSLSSKFVFLVPLAAYMIVLLYQLIPALSADEKKQEMLMPVLIYSTVISAMVVAAVNRKGRVSVDSFQWTLVGALLFMFSDSIIAINKFKEPVMYASVWIMILYIIGQFFIVNGILKQRKR